MPIISGIQQVGIGVTDAEAAWKWYRKFFGMNVPIFKDAATANLMTRYTSDKAEDRYAVLAMNMQGGGGFEIWQYTSRVPQKPDFMPKMGDYGIFAVKMKTRDVAATYAYFVENGAEVLGTPEKSPEGKLHFYVKDPYDNVFEIIESHSWFTKSKVLSGGVAGCVIGVSNIEEALPLYMQILGYDHMVYDRSGRFEDLQGVAGGNHTFRRVLLRNHQPRVGAFSKLLCDTELELVQVQDRPAKKLFENRNWGDLGFIHVCFDVRGMDKLRNKCALKGFPFTVDSSDSFDMGKAAGHFTYCEDPDGTLIEFVETHKIPIFEKLGLYLNIKNRKPEKPLPNWMLSMLSLNKVKD
ncbi:VOC family protein [Penaeicola halotolerans]|uniref:VOC family protein n=1 Tax=Penaeicola halotolerans TaxID=2793196 RepID=UPI001CF870AE|nr:VOC family protein [Penaeicola halotolerans]